MSEAATFFTVGTAECRVLADGIMAYEPASLYTGLPPEQTGPVIAPLLDDRGLVRVPYHPLLVRTAAGLALIDTGAGLGLAEQSGEPVGRLPEALAAAGVAADDVALVVLSHAHPRSCRRPDRRQRQRPAGDVSPRPARHRPDRV